MQLFFCETIILNSEVFLSQEESYHAAQVLRMRKGEIIFLTNGIGQLFKGEILQLDTKKSLVNILEEIPQQNQISNLHIAIAPTKNIDRLEWFLEKATEIGIREITPIICRYSERKEIKPERLQKVIVAAAKQSYHFHFPKLNQLIKFDDFVKSSNADVKLIAHCESSEKKDFSQFADTSKNTLLLIGPEGDFSEVEIKIAVEQKFIPVSLGEYRLRTETAGVYACSVFNALATISK